MSTTTDILALVGVGVGAYLVWDYVIHPQESIVQKVTNWLIPSQDPVNSVGGSGLNYDVTNGSISLGGSKSTGAPTVYIPPAGNNNFLASIPILGAIYNAGWDFEGALRAASVVGSV